MIDMTDKEKACLDEALKRVDRCLTIMIACAISFGLGIWSGLSYNKHKENIPAENLNINDSIIAVNDSIKIKVEKLDSIKNAKVIEVSTFDNDSTLKLFYELVSE